MKNIFISSPYYFIIISCMVIISCEVNHQDPELTTKQFVDAGTKTIANMQAAYSGEKKAVEKYEAFSKKAEEEGYTNVALLYNAVAASENIHAMNHKAVLEDAEATIPEITPEYMVKTTKINLADDINEASNEVINMYPSYLITAEAADNQIAALSLTYAMKSEKKHKFFFQQALGDINSNTLNTMPYKYFVCPACGNTYTNPPKHCDFSLTDRDKFIIFE